MVEKNPKRLKTRAPAPPAHTRARARATHFFSGALRAGTRARACPRARARAGANPAFYTFKFLKVTFLQGVEFKISVMKFEILKY